MTARLAQQAIDALTSRAKTGLWSQLLRWVQRGGLLAILIYLILRLNQTGWGEIVSALPTSPWFYILSIFIFLVPVLCELQSYRFITNSSVPDGVRVFSRKRIYNEALISYVGEVYLVGKLVNVLGLTYRNAVIAVKNNNLISALVSNTWTIMLVLALILVGRFDVLEKIWALSPLLVSSFGVFCIVIYGFALLFLRRLISLKPLLLIKVGLLHFGKILSMAILQVLQWACAMPLEIMLTWLMFLTVQVLLKRIPGLPNADLVFLGIGLSLIGFAEGSAQEISAMLVAATAMTQIVYLAGFILTLGHSKSREYDGV